MKFLRYPFEEQATNSPIGLSESSEDIFSHKESSGVVTPSNPDEVPVFLVSDILGNGNALLALAEKIHAENPNRPIFIYYDPRVLPQESHPGLNSSRLEKLSIQQLGRLIAEAMQTHLPAGSSPYAIMGYSYGCSLAAAAAEYLENLGQTTRLFLIDGPSPECSKNYFLNNTTQSTKDFVSIINYAAKLSDLEPVTLADDTISNIKHLSPLDRVEDILRRALNIQTNKDNVETLNEWVNIGKHGIKNIVNYQSGSREEQAFKKATVLITDKTAEKYGDELGGWQNYSNTITPITDSTLKTQEHQDLLNEENAAILAKKIEETLKAEITEEDLNTEKLANALFSLGHDKDEIASSLKLAADFLAHHSSQKGEKSLISEHLSKLFSSTADRISRPFTITAPESREHSPSGFRSPRFKNDISLSDSDEIEKEKLVPKLNIQGIGMVYNNCRLDQKKFEKEATETPRNDNKVRTY